MSTLSFNAKATKAILIGISNYDYLPKIEPAINNISDMVELLTDNDIVGLPIENIIQIIDKRNDEVFNDITDFLSNEENIDVETLILYYVGHGIRSGLSKELFLTGINSKYNSVRASAISFNDIKQQIEESQIQNRIVLIDSCHSGLAAMDAANEPLTNDEINIKGTYILTASKGDEKAYFNSTDRNTHFTSELLHVLKKGLPLKQPYLSLEDIFHSIQKSLKNSIPQRKSNLSSTEFYMFRNVQFNLFEFKEQKADQLFDQGNYEEAYMKYLEANFERPSEVLSIKIRKCIECLDIIKKAKIKLLIEPDSLTNKSKIQPENKDEANVTEEINKIIIPQIEELNKKYKEMPFETQPLNGIKFLNTFKLLSIIALIITLILYFMFENEIKRFR